MKAYPGWVWPNEVNPTGLWTLCEERLEVGEAFLGVLEKQTATPSKGLKAWLVSEHSLCIAYTRTITSRKRLISWKDLDFNCVMFCSHFLHVLDNDHSLYAEHSHPDLINDPRGKTCCFLHYFRLPGSSISYNRLIKQLRAWILFPKWVEKPNAILFCFGLKKFKLA